jgi:hypothetical protein
MGNELADLGIREADSVDEAEYTPMMSPIDLSYSVISKTLTLQRPVVLDLVDTRQGVGSRGRDK